MTSSVKDGSKTMTMVLNGGTQTMADEIDVDDLIDAKTLTGVSPLLESHERLDGPTSNGCINDMTAMAIGIEKAQNHEEEKHLLPAISPNSKLDERDILEPEEIRHERRVVWSEEEPEVDYGYGDGVGGDHEFSGEMDGSRIDIRRKLSMLEKMQNKFIASASVDERKEKVMPQDTFSVIAISATCSLPFLTSFCIFALQVSTFALVLLDLASEGQPGNIFGVPADVPPQLRATQFLSLVVAVITQGDLRTATILLRDGFTVDFDLAFPDTSAYKYYISILARAVSGSIGLTVSFALIVTAPSVVDLILNFTAIEFVSSIDELCFFLSRQGFFGSRCKTYATTIFETLYKIRPESRSGFVRRSWKTLSLFLLLSIFISGWCIVVSFQMSGKYLCNTVLVQLGDDFLPSLGTFNGLYDLQKSSFRQSRVQYLERRAMEIVSTGRGVLGYCDDIQAWTFRWENKDGSDSDPCEWVARSSTTNTYDITDTTSEPWLVQDKTNREVVLQPFSLFCFDCDADDDGDECSGTGTCNNAVCQCNEGWFGLRCEFPAPCSKLAIDARTEDFASTRDWATEYQTIQLESGELVVAYHRPVYVSPYPNGEYDVVMFTGRRWALTSSEFLPRGGKISDQALTQLGSIYPPTGNEIANFFHYIFHGYQGYFDDYSIAFLSDYMDAKTDRDASSPVGFLWYRAVANERTSVTENQGPAAEIQSQFLCRVCTNGSNPCLYDGECVEGECQCSLDSKGSLCEIPPVKNGHCDPFFNTPEFKMDGGDCCESTCSSTPQYFCGAEEQGYVSTGYYSCGLPPEEWQGHILEGEAGVFAGSDVDLALRSVAVSELLQDRVRIYDKVGSAWVLRDTITGSPNTRFGTSVALSAGPFNVVSNPSFLAPLTVVILDSFRMLRIYNCNAEGCTLRQEIPMTYSFDLSDDGKILALSVFQENGIPEVLRVYESTSNGTFQGRAEHIVADVAANATLGVLSISVSGNGSGLVFQKQSFKQIGENMVTEHENFEVRVWNGVEYVFQTEFAYKAKFNTYGYPLSLEMSKDGNVVAFGHPLCAYFDGLQVFKRGDGNKFVSLPPLPLNATECIDSKRPPKNNNLVLSKDGSTLAFRFGISVGVFALESGAWRKVGEGFPLIHYAIAMSSDGTELAIGSPEDGIGGISTVYSLPGRKECPSGTSLLRISVTLDRLPMDQTWSLRNNHTGEVLYEEGPYPDGYAYGTVVEEACIDTNSSCYEFSIYNKFKRGLQAPGQYALFLDGVDIGRGSFDGLREKVSFGNCDICPNGTESFSLVLQTCGDIRWAVAQLIDQGKSFTIVGNGTTSGMALADLNTYQSCSDQEGDLCDDRVEVTFDTCLDRNECYGLNIHSPYRQIVFAEMDFDGVRKTPDVVQLCSGANAFIGNQDKCLQEEF